MVVKLFLVHNLHLDVVYCITDCILKEHLPQRRMLMLMTSVVERKHLNSPNNLSLLDMLTSRTDASKTRLKRDHQQTKPCTRFINDKHNAYYLDQLQRAQCQKNEEKFTCTVTNVPEQRQVYKKTCEMTFSAFLATTLLV